MRKLVSVPVGTLTGLLAGTVGPALVMVGGAGTAGAAEPGDDGLRFASSASYELDPGAAAVRVAIDAEVTNETPDDGASYFYFDEVWIPVPSEASNVRARVTGGAALEAGVEETADPLWSDLVVTLPDDLRYRETHRLRVEYDLPDLPPRSPGLTRANAAYAAFGVFPVGDAGLSSVEVVVPAAYTVETSGSPMTETTADGATVFRAEAIEDPFTWWATVVGRDDTKLVEENLTVGEHAVTVRSWPGDEQWARFVADHVTRGIPALEDLVGRDWPVEDELTVIESSTPHIYGYGGWFDSATDVIEMGDELDPLLVLHELSHAWFDQDLSAEIWLSEGLAEEYAVRAATAIGSMPADDPAVPPVPKAPAADATGRQPLAQWQQDLAGEADVAADDYGYATARWLVHQLVEEIGLEAMTSVIAAAVDGDIAYQADTEPESWVTATDWQRALDLVEELGGSSRGAELFAGYVVPETAAAALEERAAARVAYDELAAAGGGWEPPYEVRLAMSRWRFAEVGDLVTGASAVLADRGDALPLLAQWDVDALPVLEDAYERSDDVAALAGVSGRYADVARKLMAAEDAVGAGGVGGVLAGVGLLGADAEDRLQAVASALEDGRLGTAEAGAAEVSERVEGAVTTGAVRYAAFALTLAGAGLLWRERRRRIDSGEWPTV